MDVKFNKKFLGKGSEGMIISLYYIYKEYVVSIAFIASGILFILLVLIPQVRIWFELQSQVRELRESNAVLSENLAFISSFSNQQIDSQVKIVGNALPPDKEFALVLNSITQASSKSNISLSDYSFQVGELASSSAIQDNTRRPSISIELGLSGNIVLLKNFFNELYRQAPLVEASEISYTTASSLAKVDFFYKPSQPLQVNVEKPILKIAGNDQVVLDTITGWSNSSISP